MLLCKSRDFGWADHMNMPETFAPPSSGNANTWGSWAYTWQSQDAGVYPRSGTLSLQPLQNEFMSISL